MQQFQIRKDDFLAQQLVTLSAAEEQPELIEGQVRLAVDSFAFTANNITYAAAGNQLGYWQFFPPVGEQRQGWGVIPVWGFANVIESRCEQLPVGERLFGYFPPASQLIILPTHVSDTRLIDGSAHRAKLPPGYNSYSRVLHEADYELATEPERMLLWPLHITSFCLWDALKDKDWRGAQQIIILSASSKTSAGLAYALAQDADAPATVAVTSARNTALVKSLQVYDHVVEYEQLSHIDTSLPSVIVDMSGNSAVLNALAEHLGEKLNYCINVGLTHWDETQSASAIPAERREFFFAPGHIQQRMKDWGPQGFAERSQRFMHDAAGWSRQWLKVNTRQGLGGLAEIYPDVCQGRIAADEGIIIQLAQPD
ncbi:DUF2855 family protein [Halopseudomonas sabulinigri]|uniref:DUF2855 family protein n=1 Tax=Halopseudomonas sabulinigri TaxID=472181 RepID=A0ABP9ZQW6_9GAMM